jgi:hypothetical protein
MTTKGRGMRSAAAAATSMRLQKRPALIVINELGVFPPALIVFNEFGAFPLLLYAQLMPFRRLEFTSSRVSKWSCRV